jgi:hypothetical protein
VSSGTTKAALDDLNKAETKLMHHLVDFLLLAGAPARNLWREQTLWENIKDIPYEPLWRGMCWFVSPVYQRILTRHWSSLRIPEEVLMFALMCDVAQWVRNGDRTRTLNAARNVRSAIDVLLELSLLRDTDAAKSVQAMCDYYIQYDGYDARFNVDGIDWDTHRTPYVTRMYADAIDRTLPYLKKATTVAGTTVLAPPGHVA